MLTGKSSHVVNHNLDLNCFCELSCMRMCAWQLESTTEGDFLDASSWHSDALAK